MVAAFFLLSLLFSEGTALAHTPDWVSRALEWALGKKAALTEAPSAGWMEPKQAPDFRLVDQDDRLVSLQEFRGKVVLMNFMYTGCGGTCSSLKELGILAKALGGKMGKEVVFVSISLDPERDTPETLKAFGQKLKIRTGWRLLTGASTVIEKLTEAYGVYVRRIGTSHLDTHIEYGDMILFLDMQGRLRKRVLPHLLQLSGRADIKWLLGEHYH